MDETIRKSEVGWYSLPMYHREIPCNKFSGMNIWTPLWGLHELKESTEKYKLFDLVKHHAIIYLSVKKPRRISWIYFGTTEKWNRTLFPFNPMVVSNLLLRTIKIIH